MSMNNFYREADRFQKKIIITVSEGMIARNILRSGVPHHLLRDPEVFLFLAVPEDKFEFYEKEFSAERVRVTALPVPPMAGFSRLLFYAARNGFRTETILTDQMTRFLIDHSYTSLVIKRCFNFVFGRSRLFHGFIRFLASFRKPSRPMAKFFADVNPMLLFATDVQDELDVDAMAAARTRGVTVVGMVRSWDNLSSSAGLIQIVPDRLIVWNPYLCHKATTVQHVPRERIVVVGIPQYDWYIREDLLQERIDFLKSFGLQWAEKIILFAGIGNYHAPHEVEVAEIISEAIAAGKIPERTGMIFRPHPNFTVDRERVRKFPWENTVFDEGVASYTGKKPSTFEMDQDKMAHLMNSLYHADLIVTTASTMTIDAVAFGKPVICIAFDGKSSEPYWNSVERYYADYTHYKDITQTNGFKIARSAEELIRYINQYLDDPRCDEKGRNKIRDEFIWRLDGRSAERVAAILKNALTERLNYV